MIAGCLVYAVNPKTQNKKLIQIIMENGDTCDLSKYDLRICNE